MDDYYTEYILKNFGNHSLKGFKYILRACELYDDILTIKEIYEIIAKENSVTRISVERAIRYYIISSTNKKSCEDMIGSWLSSKEFIARLKFYARLMQK